MRAPNLTLKRAKSLRRTMTPPETRIWVRLRKRVSGLPMFRRQHPIGPYILDFFCKEAALAVEIDGSGHGMGDRPDRDQARDAWLARQGIETMRIAASEVMADPDEVADRICGAALQRLKT